MTINTYYKFLAKYKLSAQQSLFVEENNTVLTRIDSVGYKNGDIYVNGVVLRNARVEPLTGHLYSHIITFGPSMWLDEGVKAPRRRTPVKRKPKKCSGRVRLCVTDVSQWIADLILNDHVKPLDEFDIDVAKGQKIIQGGAIKYASHSLPLEDILWRPHVHIHNGLLFVIDNDRQGMTKEEVRDFLKVNRNGARADWWFLYQVVLRYGHEDVLKKAPWRTLVECKDEGLWLTIPVAYPEATVTVKKPSSKVWDPF